MNELAIKEQENPQPNERIERKKLNSDRLIDFECEVPYHRKATVKDYSLLNESHQSLISTIEDILKENPNNPSLPRYINECLFRGVIVNANGTFEYCDMGNVVRSLEEFNGRYALSSQHQEIVESQKKKWEKK